MSEPSGRAGRFLAIPRAWLEAVRAGKLTVEQLGLGALLAGEANYREPTAVRADDGRTYFVDVAEVLVGRRKLADRCHMGKGGRDRVRRAIERGDALGLWASRPAEAAPPSAPDVPPGCAPPSAPPPTIISFKKDAALLFMREEAAPPSAPPPAPGAAPSPTPIQHRNTRTPNTEKPSPSPTAPARRGRQGSTSGVDPRHHQLQELLEATYLEAKGKPYGFQGGRDGKAVADLLRLSGGAQDEVLVRWRHALELGARWPGCASIALLADRWNELALAPGGVPSALPGRLTGRRETSTGADPGCIEWGRAGKRVHAGVRLDLWETWFAQLRGEMRGEELVLTAPDSFHASFLTDNYTAFLTEQVSAELGRPTRVVVEAPDQQLVAGGARS